MPEISLFLFDVEYLFKLFPKLDKKLHESISDYETQAEEAMAENRIKLFQ